MPTGARLVMDNVKLAEMLRSPEGPVVRRLLEDGEVVRRGAKRRVGVHQLRPGERRSRRPGTLRDSIVKRVTTIGGQPAVIVGSDDPIALWHHEGTHPHIIEARPGGLLVFYWDRMGRVVAFPRVHHPGTRPNRYLTDALNDLRGRY